jgi:hypothetical protein
MYILKNLRATNEFLQLGQLFAVAKILRMGNDIYKHEDFILAKILEWTTTAFPMAVICRNKT